MIQRDHPDPIKAFLLYLALLSVLGCAVVYAATSKLGPGVSTDSATILSAADNLKNGRGITDYWGAPLTQFPPLYSILLAIGSLLIGKDVFIIGWGLNILFFGALIWFSGLYFFNAFRSEPILAYLGSFIIFSSTSLIQISANIASDPLFLLLVVFFLMTTTDYLNTGIRKYLFIAAALTILASFQRYAGLTLVIVGGLIIAFKNRHHFKDALLSASLYIVLTALPIFLWGFLHNAPVNGTVFGGRLPAVPIPNFIAGVEKILYWFIPYPIISVASPLVLFAVILALAILAIIKTDPGEFLSKLRSPTGVPNLSFLLVYSAVLVFDISYYELKGINTDRVHIIALPSLLIILLSVGQMIIKAAKRRFTPFHVYIATGLLFVAWSIYPISRAYQYVNLSLEHGDISSYNSINKIGLRDSNFSTFLTTLNIQNKKIYSNGADSAWFALRTQVSGIPGVPSGEKQRLLYVQQHYRRWPGKGNDGYLIWFNSEAHKDFLATPHELTSVADLNPLYSDPFGSVYYVKSP